MPPVIPRAAGKDCGNLHVAVSHLLWIHLAVPWPDLAHSVAVVPPEPAPGVRQEPGPAQGVSGQPVGGTGVHSAAVAHPESAHDVG